MDVGEHRVPFHLPKEQRVFHHERTSICETRALHRVDAIFDDLQVVYYHQHIDTGFSRQSRNGCAPDVLYANSTFEDASYP